MMTMLRRLFLLGLLGGGGYAGWMFWQQRRDDDGDAAPEWPPLDPPDTATIAANIPTADPTPPLEPKVSGFASMPADVGAIEPEPNPEAVDRSDVDEERTLAEAIANPIEPPTPAWVDPVDGECPEGYPVKANDNSGIYHVPGGRFYDRTVPERCYADAEAAAADGYRAAKS